VSVAGTGIVISSTTVALSPAIGAFVDAIDCLDGMVPIAHPYGRMLLQRASEHLLQQLEKEIGRAPRPSSEQQAYAMLKGLATDLQIAGQALVRAAEIIKASGRGVHANDAYVAGQKALQTAEEWLS
jgi:hypothetical protein